MTRTGTPFIIHTTSLFLGRFNHRTIIGSRNYTLNHAEHFAFTFLAKGLAALVLIGSSESWGPRGTLKEPLPNSPSKLKFSVAQGKDRLANRILKMATKFILMCVLLAAVQGEYIRNDTEVVKKCEHCVENGTSGFYKEIFVSWSGPQYFCRDTPLDPEFGMIVDFACNKSKFALIG